MEAKNKWHIGIETGAGRIVVALTCFYNFQRWPDAWRKKVCNGAGPRNFGWLVPDTLYGLSISRAADIHDACYQLGKTIEDKKQADRTFKDNMIRIIGTAYEFSSKSIFQKLLKHLRLSRANKYYVAVDVGGGPAFWDKTPIPEIDAGWQNI